MREPLVSVITPLYNYEQYIADAIESVLNQSYPHIEMIIVDDGSNDRGPDIVAAHADKRIRLIRQERHGCGISRALNTAIDAARGEYISWLSADDYYLPNKIERNLQVFQEQSQRRPRLGLAHSLPGVESSDPAYLKKYCPLPASEQQRQLNERGAVYWPFQVEPAGDDDILFCSLLWNQINGCTTLIPKSVFQAIGGFKNSWAIAQDYDMWLRIMLAGYDVCYIPEVLTVSRFHPVNTTLYANAVGAEANLISRLVQSQVKPVHIQKSLMRQKISLKDYPFWCAQMMGRQAIYDQALWLIEQSEKTIDSFKQQLKAQINPFILPDPIYEASLTWLITLTPEAFQSRRLFAVLTEFCKAFSASDSVRMLCWCLPESLVQADEYIRQIKVSIAGFLKCSLDNLPCIEVCQGDLLGVAAITNVYLPVGNPAALESQCIYSFRTQNRCIQWSAESIDFQSMLTYILGLSYWCIYPDRKAGEHLSAGTVLITFSSSNLTRFFWRSAWWELQKPTDAAEYLLKQVLSEQSLFEMAHFCSLPLPASTYLPGWMPRSEQGLDFRSQDIQGEIVLCLYTVDNTSCWKECLRAFLSVALNQPQFTLLILAKASEDLEEHIFQEVLKELSTHGTDPETLQNVSIICQDTLDWSAIFQSVWMFLYPVKEPQFWSSFWPALGHSPVSVLTLPWMSESLQSSFWLSTSSSAFDIAEILGRAIQDRNTSHAKAVSLQAHFPVYATESDYLKSVVLAQQGKQEVS